jgi:hypothetical protein
MGRILSNVLRVASVPVGVLVGLWTAQLTTVPSEYKCPPAALCLDILKFLLKQPRFATWQCILFGAGAAVVLLLLSLVASRLPSATRLKAS